MGIQTHLFSNGTKALLYRKGNQSIMQLLDEAGNVLRTRCKSIKRTTVPISTDAPVRTSIGFIPQQLKSHCNDRTRRQIGFMLPGQEPKRFKNGIKRNKFVTITKTDFDSNMDVVNISNKQRKYNCDGKYMGTIPIGITSRQQIAMLNQEQRHVLMTAKEFHSDSELLIKTQLGTIENDITSLNADIVQMQQNQKVLEQALLINKKKQDFVYGEITKLGLLDGYWNTNIAPKILASPYPQFAKSPTFKAEEKVSKALQQLLDEKDYLQNLLNRSALIVENNIRNAKELTQQKGAILGMFEQLKSHYTETDDFIRKTLCNLQKKISSVIVKAN